MKLQNLNSTLQTLNLSPVSKSKLSRLKHYSLDKLTSASEALKNSFDSVVVEQSVSYADSGNLYEKAGREMITQLKEKFEMCENSNEKIQILSVLPKSWSVHKIQSKLDCHIQHSN